MPKIRGEKKSGKERHLFPEKFPCEKINPQYGKDPEECAGEPKHPRLVYAESHERQCLDIHEKPFPSVILGIEYLPARGWSALDGKVRRTERFESIVSVHCFIGIEARRSRRYVVEPQEGCYNKNKHQEVEVASSHSI